MSSHPFITIRFIVGIKSPAIHGFPSPQWKAFLCYKNTGHYSHSFRVATYIINTTITRCKFLLL
ncbi:hypothetical protein CW304_13440 [Bacillus sp. UFRGS-B20]|nr:hypothetical protein CW304_13440 [Bacillus sp. UFRGS-B20]